MDILGVIVFLIVFVGIAVAWLLVVLHNIVKASSDHYKPYTKEQIENIRKQINGGGK